MGYGIRVKLIHYLTLLTEYLYSVDHHPESCTHCGKKERFVRGRICYHITLEANCPECYKKYG